jgi:heptosyltransferase-2
MESRTLVLQTAHLGDVVLTLPLLMRLAARVGPVDVVTTPEAAPLVTDHAAVRRVIPFDKHATARGPVALWRLASELRTGGYARAILVQGSLRTGLLAWLAGIPSRIGFAGSPGAILYTMRQPRPEVGHWSERLLALDPGAAAVPPPWLKPGDGPRSRVAAWLEAGGIEGDFTVLAPYARWGTKRWPGFMQLADRLEGPLVIVGGPGDRTEALALATADPARIRVAAGALSLPETAALIARARVVVTNDSVALHLATALNRPAVAIFGPTVPAFGFGPLSGVVVEHAGLACRPCSAHGPARCPLGHHRCMREVPVEAVVNAVSAILETDRSRLR